MYARYIKQWLKSPVVVGDDTSIVGVVSDIYPIY